MVLVILIPLPTFQSRLFIYPGMEFKIVQLYITNVNAVVSVRTTRQRLTADNKIAHKGKTGRAVEFRVGAAYHSGNAVSNRPPMPKQPAIPSRGLGSAVTMPPVRANTVRG